MKYINTNKLPYDELRYKKLNKPWKWHGKIKYNKLTG